MTLSIPMTWTRHRSKSGIDDAIHLGPSLTAFSDELRRDKCHLNATGRDQLVEDTLQFLSETGLAAP